MLALKAKLALGAGIVLILALSFFYIKGLNSKIDHLKLDNAKLEEVSRQNEEAIREQSRRHDVVDQINGLGDKERVIIQRDYNNKIKRIDQNVSEGKDREVGPLLNDFFSYGLPDN